MNRSKIGKMTLLIVAIAIIVLMGLRSLSNARSYQILGSIYPRIPTSEKVLALTLDDGPSENVDTVLAILKRHEIKATFFVIGNAVEQHFSEMEKLVKAGHEMGNHSYSHDPLILKSYGRIRKEIEQTDALIRQAGYSEIIHFRPPFGKKLVMLPYYLHQHHRTTIMWDIYPDTYADPLMDAEKITRQVLEKAKSGSIILLHVLSKENSEVLEALPQIIKGLKGKGFQFKTVSELLELK